MYSLLEQFKSFAGGGIERDLKNKQKQKVPAGQENGGEVSLSLSRRP